METSIIAGASAAFGFAAGIVAILFLGDLPTPRATTTGECEAIRGDVVVMAGAEISEAVCLKDGTYWPVRVDVWTRYGRALQ